jgi:uncharacterized membrane protein
MDKTKFLTVLREHLKRLPEREIENAVAYYEEYFLDAGDENEQSVLEKLGPPGACAAKIIGEYTLNEAAANTSERGKRGGGSFKLIWIALLAICASPVAVPIVIAIVAVLFALMIAFGSVMFAIVFAGIAVVFNSVASIIAGLILTADHFPTALFITGYGLLSGALCVAIVCAAVALIKLFARLTKKMLGKILIKRGVV